MNMKREWLYIGLCIFLAVLADVSLFQEEVGISYSIFMGAFYIVFFYQFRSVTFQHKQISGLLFFCILVLTLSFTLYSNSLFNAFNFILIPIFVFAHTVLLTSPMIVRWYSNSFVSLLFKKIGQMFKCGSLVTTFNGRRVKRKMDESTYQTAKRIGIGIIISIPLLFVITSLLSAADEQFARILSLIPETLFSLQFDFIWRILKIALIAMAFFCFFKVVTKKTILEDLSQRAKKREWDSIIVTTILIFINLVYLLFVIVQFQYFFSGTLQEGFSYAEYARRGFFELVLVTIINYIILMCTVTFVRGGKSSIIKILLTFLITFSGILLSSAFLRLMLYEQAYGFTTSRILAHAFMIYLFIVFAFTLVKVWAERLSLARFYIIFTVLYYVGLNIIGIDQIIVSNNIERYEMTEKIDVDYLEYLSYSAIPPLVDLYKQDPDIPGLYQMLMEKKEELFSGKQTWQSFNIAQIRAKNALEQIGK